MHVFRQRGCTGCCIQISCKGFKAGAAVTYMRTEPSVMRIKDIRRRVINEARYFRNLRGLILLMERYMYVTLNRRAM